MGKWIKRSVFTLALLLLLAAIGVVLLVTAVDPNQWKGQIERAAREQGIQLTLTGDLSWQFFPSLAIQLGKTAIDFGHADPRAPLVQFDYAVAQVALKPLMDRRIMVDNVTLQAPSIFLAESSDGNNFSPPNNQPTHSASADSTTPENTSPTTTSHSDAKPLALEISVITIQDGKLTYAATPQAGDGTPAQWDIDQLQVTVNNSNLSGKPFTLAASFQIANSELAIAPTLDLSGTLQYNQQAQTFDWQNGRAIVSADNQSANLQFSVDGSFAKSFNAKGQFKTDEINARQWFSALQKPLPTMQSPSALSKVSAEFSYTVTPSRLTLSNLVAVIDASTVRGKVDMQFPSISASTQAVPFIKGDFTLDTINVDHYLSPSDTTQTAPTENGQTQTTEEPLPLDSLRSVDADVQLAVDSLYAMGLTLTTVAGTIHGKRGEWTLKPFTANAYNGQLNSSATVTAENNRLTSRFNAELNNIMLNPLLSDLADFSDLTGTFNVTLSGDTHGQFASQLLANSVATLTAQSDALQVEGINFEKHYCSVAYQLDQTSEIPSAWPTASKVDNVSLRINWKDQIAHIADLQADTSNLHITATGSANWLTKGFSVRFPLTISQERTSPTGCVIRSKFLQQEAIDIVRCKGSLSTLNLSEACGIDSDGIKDLAKEALRYNADKKIDEKKKEIREELKEKLWEALF